MRSVKIHRVKKTYIVEVLDDGNSRQYVYADIEAAQARAKRLCYILDISPPLAKA